MKHAIVILLALMALNSISCGPVDSPRNLAADFAKAIDPDASCAAYFTDAGDHHAYAAVCRLPAFGTSAYCSISADVAPQCTPLVDRGNAATASAHATPRPTPQAQPNPQQPEPSIVDRHSERVANEPPHAPPLTPPTPPTHPAP